MERVLAQFEGVAPAVTATPGAAAWTAREAGTGRRVLIKRLPGDEAKARATQALTLHHPRIAPTRRWLRDGDGLYVVRDFVPGVNVRQALGAAAQTAFDRLQALFLPLLDALEYAHGRGLPHGGVTPENVVLTGDDGGTGPTVLTDWATSLVTPKDYEIPPTPRTDYVALCELYKEFLPTRPADDEAGQTGRARLLRNLTEIQHTAQSAEEVRYKLDAVARMADLLGFSAQAPAPSVRQGARLVVAVTPPAATLNPGGGVSLSLSLRNGGDALLRVEAIESNAVWLNPAAWATPVDLMPDNGRDVPLTVSAARLSPGNYQAQLLIRSNSGLGTLRPAAGASWHEQAVTVPVLVQGRGNSAAPLAEELPPPPPTPRADSAGIACTQEPDPGLVRYGQNGVLHLGVQNVGPRRLRLDKLKTNPSWLVYPGEWQPLWVEPGATQFLGFSVRAQALAGGDYTAQVTLLTSSEEPTLLGSQLAWREMSCDVRVRVVRGAADVRPDAARFGCLPVLLALGASFVGLIALLMVR